MENILSKIRKLLAMSESVGATEAEAQNAMALATALMTKYGIEQEALNIKSSVGKERFHKEKREQPYISRLILTAANLYACRMSYQKGSECTYTLYGEEHNRKAAIETYYYLRKQLEWWYKQSLPKGMSVSTRANFRRTFKWACATRLLQRANDIINQMSENDEAAAATGSNALVVADYFEVQLNKIAEWMQQDGIRLKTTKSKTKKYGLGTSLGTQAGDSIRIQGALK